MTNLYWHDLFFGHTGAVSSIRHPVACYPGTLRNCSSWCIYREVWTTWSCKIAMKKQHAEKFEHLEYREVWTTCSCKIALKNNCKIAMKTKCLSIYVHRNAFVMRVTDSRILPLSTATDRAISGLSAATYRRPHPRLSCVAWSISIKCWASHHTHTYPIFLLQSEWVSEQSASRRLHQRRWSCSGTTLYTHINKHTHSQTHTNE